MLTVNSFYILFTSSRVQANIKRLIDFMIYFHTINAAVNNGNNSPKSSYIAMIYEGGDAA